MTTEEERIIQEQERQLSLANAQNQQSEVEKYQQSLAMQDQEKGMIREQLDLTEELEYIHHLLKGDIKVKDEYGNVKWKPAEDRRLVVLSQYGVDFIMNTLQFYLNKNTLLSNYDETTILQKMEDIANAINDYVFMHYESVFEYPTFEDCKKILEERIKRRTDIRKFALELAEQEADEKEIREEILSNMEGEVERELAKIKEQLIKDKLKRFELLVRVIQDTIHNTYQRSWKGQERTTLRQHIHISENKSPPTPQAQPQPKLNPFGFLGGRR